MRNQTLLSGVLINEAGKSNAGGVLHTAAIIGYSIESCSYPQKRKSEAVVVKNKGLAFFSKMLSYRYFVRRQAMIFQQYFWAHELKL